MTKVAEAWKEWNGFQIIGWSLSLWIIVIVEKSLKLSSYEIQYDTDAGIFNKTMLVAQMKIFMMRKTTATKIWYGISAYLKDQTLYYEP